MEFRQRSLSSHARSGDASDTEAITAKSLIQRLMAVYGAKSYEQLARELNVPLRTLQRWATNDAQPGFAATIGLLYRAGWLNTGADAPSGAGSSQTPLEAIRESLANLLLGQAQGLERLERVEQELRDERSARKPAAPQKKTRRQTR